MASLAARRTVEGWHLAAFSSGYPAPVMMKKTLAVMIAASPASAVAHASDSVYLLVWWHVALALGVVGFLLFSTRGVVVKLQALAGLAIGTVLAWSIPGSLRPSASWQEDIVAVVLGIAPVVGFLAGMHVAERRVEAT